MLEDKQYIPLIDVERRIAEIEDQLAKLPIELEMLKHLRSGAVLLDVPPRNSPTGADTPIAAGPGTRTTDVIIEYLRKHPRTEPPAVARALEGKIQSKARNKRRMLLSTIYNMTRKGRLETDEQGRLTVARNGTERR